MTDDSDDTAWPPAMFASQLQRASEEFTEQQLRLFEEMLSASADSDPRSSNGLSDLGAMSTEAAVFKTRVQSGGRISIPDAEREALGIDEGELVQAFVVPIDNDSDSDD